MRNIIPNLKLYFVIFNLVLAIISFSYLVSAASSGVDPNMMASTANSMLQIGQMFQKSQETSMPSPTRGHGSYGGGNSMLGGPESKNPAIAENKIMNTSIGSQSITIPTQGKKNFQAAFKDYYTDLLNSLFVTGAGAVGGLLIGIAFGGKDGWMWGAISGGAGALTYQLLSKMGYGWQAVVAGLGVGILIFLLTYKKESKKIVEFNCLPWQAPIGGNDCESCNDYPECSEYACKSLGQACDLVNKGTKEQKCVWKNPYDTNSPIIEMGNVSLKLKFQPDTTVRPPATGVEIYNTDGTGRCVKAFTPLEFSFKTNEPSQCKVDYNLTSDPKLAFEQMNFYVGGSATYTYNHTETMSLPGVEAINRTAPQLSNDGVFTLYIRCADANGNFNVNPFSVRFCVDKGPDETPPIIVNVSMPSGSPIQFNRTSLAIQVYVNEPSDCKWSREDREYDNMENSMICNNNLWEMNNQNTYTCLTNLTGIESRKENDYFFKCMDKPGEIKSERNVDSISYLYTVIGTQPLNILDLGPTDTVKGATDSIPVTLFVKTDNGYDNGIAKCYYSLTNKEDGYIEFSNTTSSYHTQRQDLPNGKYEYFIKCIDLGGNAAYNSTNFIVETDTESPDILRMYRESGELKLLTGKESECSYSNINCNFEIADGIMMLTLDSYSHVVEWKPNQAYYIRCKDKYNNQPDPNVCSAIVKTFEFYNTKDVLTL